MIVKSRIKYLLCIVFFLHGCSYTLVSKISYYPSGANKSTAQYQMFIEVQGESGHAYVDMTKKKICLSIWKGEEKIFYREYECKAAALSWNIAWNKLDDITVVFFDFKEGISIYNNKDKENAKQILSLHFTYDSKLNKFVEYPIQFDVVNQFKKKQ